jgi:excisionase family DNA binding protein
MTTEPWLTVEQVAFYLGVTKDAIYSSQERRGLPGQTIGRFWKFQLFDADKSVRAGSAGEANNQKLGTAQ